MYNPIPFALGDEQALAYFWARVERTDTCWLWRGSVNRANGRPIATFEQRDFYAYRVGYALLVGSVPTDRCVCHRCDNPVCVRPDHLFLGTPDDNWADMRAKRRHRTPKAPRGIEHHDVTVGDEIVAMVRDLYASGRETQDSLAARFSVSRSTVGRWVRGCNRREAGGPITSLGETA